MKRARQPVRNLDGLHSVIEGILRAARIPGAALAVVADGKTIYSRGFGRRDLKTGKRVTPDTVYPIASTTKPMNATLLGMLVEEGRLEWDAPVQRYLPKFRLKDDLASARVTVRDLVTMRTGLPRHDWVWVGNPKNRADMVERLAYLDLSADFRQRFQYCNLSSAAAGHIAEVITGQSWESLAAQRLFRPLGMRRTSCARPTHDNVSSSYHENARRKLLLSRRHVSQVIAPAGGAVHSTVADMGRWISFNLEGGKANGRRLMGRKTLAQIHAPQVVIGERPLAGLPPDGSYSLGWLVDSYNGHKRLSHGGYLHDVHSSVMLFPVARIGMVAFTNFGCAVLAHLLNQCAFDALMGLPSVETAEQKLTLYEKKIEDIRKRNASLVRASNTGPSLPLSAYRGDYVNAGYGRIRVGKRGRGLILQRDALRLPLQHWHYDVWVARDSDIWTIHEAHAFDRGCQIHFCMDAHGHVAGLTIPLEPEVEPIRFVKI